MSFINELKRRNVLRIAVAYLAGAWLLIQVLETLFPIYGLQESSIRLVVVILAIGFVPALVVAWVFELTPGGIIRDTGANSVPPRDSQRTFDRIIILVLGLAVVIFAADSFILDPARDARNIEKAEKAARSTALIESFGEKSIAVMPFDNMSSDPEQTFFADGIAEELLNLLARVEGLRVISRTSSFQFKDSDISLTEIAEILDVAHILEGSVRKSGNTIRITVQLIDAHTDAHLWAQTYDHEFNNIFAIQDDVAAQVVEQLRLQMSVDVPTAVRHDPQAYQLYLQAAQLQDYGQHQGRLEEAEQLLLRVLEIESGYMNAKIRLGWIYREYANYFRSDVEPDHELAMQYGEKEDRLVQEVTAIEPENAMLNSWLAFRGPANLFASAEYLKIALGKEPTNKNALNGAMLLMTRLRRYSSAQQIGEYLRFRDPIWYLAPRNLAEAYLEDGELALAEQTSRSAVNLNSDNSTARWRLGLILLFQGNPEAALEQFQSPQMTALPYKLQGTALALHDLNRMDEFASVMAQLVEQFGTPEDNAQYWPYGLARAYAWMGDADNAFRYLDEIKKEEIGLLFMDLHGPFFSQLRHYPRWNSYLESVGQSPEQLAKIEFDPHLPAEILAALNKAGR